MAKRSAWTTFVASGWLDRALAVTFALGSLVELNARPDAPDSALAAPLVVLVCSTLVVRRRHPVAAVAVLVAALLTAAVAGFGGDLPPVSAAPVTFILSYSCGAHAPLRRGLLAVAGLIATAQVSMGFSEFPNVEILFMTLAPWWVGWEVGRRRQLVNALEERTRELEAEQDVFVGLSVRRERARIARELHDIVAHHLAVIVVQAGAGRMAGSENGPLASERLASIRQSGDQALAEMSRLVDIIHSDSGPSRDGADRLRAVVEDARAAGLGVDVTPLLADVRLPAEIEDDALRVVQEGLTNAMKHAPGARVRVRLALTDDSLELEVRDHGGGPPSALARTGAGLGLDGMRERIESLGGSLEAGPCEDGGWRVAATLPTAARPLASAR
jgi:signal transduction histidine kinase